MLCPETHPVCLAQPHAILYLMSNDSSNMIRTPNHGGKLKNPRFVCLHYTVSENLRGTVNWLRNKASRASAHLVVGRDGAVESVVPFDVVAWHAGKSSYKGYQGLNNYSLGIELVNWGPLKRSPEGVFTPVAGTKVIAPEDVFTGRHKNGQTRYEHWQQYTPEQIAAVDKLLTGLFKDFSSLVEVVGHDDIAPDRKTDPGPAFDVIMRQLQKAHNRY